MDTCQFCGAPATVHLTQIVNKQKHEMHLCDKCEQEHHLLPPGPAPDLNIPAILQLLFGQPHADAPAAPPAADPGSLNCPACGLKYVQFKTAGRLGCPHEYDAFRANLEPLLERIHRGLTHAGKRPANARRAATVADLQGQLAAAVAAEDYEQAARLRDRIRQMGPTG